MKERLLGWIASAQRIEADVLMGEVDFTADQAMQPVLGDAEVVAEQIDITVRGAAAARSGRYKPLGGAGRRCRRAASSAPWRSRTR